MILIITHKLDFTADFLINQLNKDGVPYLRLNCEDLLTNPKYFIETGFELEAAFENSPSIHSVWFRRTQMPALTGLSFQEQLYFDREFESLLDNLSASLENKRWLSNPFSVRKAENKIIQLRTASKVGFNIPKTLVTNSKPRLRIFFEGNTTTIIKPLYSGRVPNSEGSSIFFTNKINKAGIDNLEDFDLTPCLYQEYIEKEYELRVTVVNEKLFAVKINSQIDEQTKTDWRRGKSAMVIYDLPVKIGAMCISICKKLNLKFGAIDIIKAINGDYVFLEVNPNGQWAWIEMETGLPISNAIINYLKHE